MKKTTFVFLVLILALFGLAPQALAIPKLEPSKLKKHTTETSSSTSTATDTECAYTSTTASVSFIVTTLSDTADTDTADGLCADSSGNCSLRAATEESNANIASAYMVDFDVDGTFTLSSNLKVQGTITLNGNGKPATVISGSSSANNITISSNYRSETDCDIANLTLNNLTITQMETVNSTRAVVTMNECTLGNSGDGKVSAIFSSGTLTITDSLISNNNSGEFGTIYNTGELSVSGSKITGNKTTNSNDIGNFGDGTVEIGNTTFFAN